MIESFQDQEQGGFWFTSHDHETLIHRTKPLLDEAMPAGNGVAAWSLQRLGHLLGEPRWLAAAEQTLRLADGSMRHLPYAHATLLSTLDEWLDPPETLVIRAGEERLAAWRREAQRGYRPRRLVLAIPVEEVGLPGTLAAMVAGEQPRIYRCRGTHCDPPLESFADLADSGRP
jgi:hypothetical protein